MFHKGLNKELIINEAKALIEQDGFSAFSMRRLAEELGVKTASLYAHVESMEALFTEIGLAALREQRTCLLNAVGEAHGDAAIEALAEGYRCFAAEHAELYRFILQMPAGNDAVLKEAAAMTAEPFMWVLEDYQLTEEQRMHWQRVLRGLMHGFASEEQAGYFSHYPVSAEDSYKTAVKCLINGLHGEAGENNVR